MTDQNRRKKRPESVRPSIQVSNEVLQIVRAIPAFVKEEGTELEDAYGYDGIFVKVMGNKLIVGYNAFMSLEQTYDLGKKGIEDLVVDNIMEAVKIIKEKYKSVRKKSLKLSNIDRDDIQIRYEYVNNNKSFLKALAVFEIGGVPKESEIEYDGVNTLKEHKELRDMIDRFRKGM